MSADRDEQSGTEYPYEFDITRADEYQGPLNRVQVRGQISYSIIMTALGFTGLLLSVASAAPPWGYVASAGVALFGALATLFWGRAYRRGRVPDTHDERHRDEAPRVVEDAVSEQNPSGLMDGRR